MIGRALEDENAVPGDMGGVTVHGWDSASSAGTFGMSETEIARIRLLMGFMVVRSGVGGRDMESGGVATGGGE